MLKKIPSGQNRQYKNFAIFFSQAPTHHRFTYNLQYLAEAQGSSL